MGMSAEVPLPVASSPCTPHPTDHSSHCKFMIEKVQWLRRPSTSPRVNRGEMARFIGGESQEVMALLSESKNSLCLRVALNKKLTSFTLCDFRNNLLPTPPILSSVLHFRVVKIRDWLISYVGNYPALTLLVLVASIPHWLDFFPTSVHSLHP
jgi:hypothetical protein